MKLVLVRWKDAYSHDAGWKNTDTVRRKRAPRAKSVGWIIKETVDEITIASSFIEDECDGDVVIPKGMITKIEELGPKK